MFSPTLPLRRLETSAFENPRDLTIRNPSRVLAMGNVCGTKQFVSAWENLSMLMTRQRRPAIRTLGGWAINVLNEAGAIRECEEHG